MVLHARLDAFAESEGLRAEGQAGFRFNRGTADHIYVLRHLIDRARLAPAPRRRLFACFVDFENAYNAVRRDALLRLLAGYGVAGAFLETLAGMYWRVQVRPKQAGALGAPFNSTCGVRQGDPLSPLLFGIFIDRVEAFLVERAPEVGARLEGWGRVSVLLYADDLVLLSHDPQGLQALLDALHAFCEANHVRVNVAKTEIVAFGKGVWKAPRAWPGWRYAGEPLPLTREFKYLGIVLHHTGGMSAAIARLRAAGLRAIWGMHSRCKAQGITDFSLRARLYRVLAAPILTYGAEVWGPSQLQSMKDGLTAGLQVLQNDYIRHLGGLRRSVPAPTLCAESCLPPLALQWLRACVRHWNRLTEAPHGILKCALAGDLALTSALPPGDAHRTWAGAWLRTLGWLASDAGPAGAQVGAYARSVEGAMQRAGGDPVLLLTSQGRLAVAHVEDAWDAALAAYIASQRPAGAHATYASCFKVGPAEREVEEGFPPEMPYYFRHTSRFNHHEHARALMRLRCCSTPFAACPTLHTGAPVECRRCPAAPPETAEHALLDCPAYADLRESARFAPLFENPLPPQARMRAVASQKFQRLLAEFVHACFERHAEPM